MIKKKEPKLRIEFIKKIRKTENQRGIPFKNINELRKIIERDSRKIYK